MPGIAISPVEITQISQHGLWVLVQERKLFLPFDAFPWFRNATVGQILAVKEIHPGHLYWPKLDVDLTLDAIEHPEDYPPPRRGQGFLRLSSFHAIKESSLTAS